VLQVQVLAEPPAVLRLGEGGVAGWVSTTGAWKLNSTTG